MWSELRKLPPLPLVIGGVATLIGCLLIAGILYALLVPPSKSVADVAPTATRTFITATPIATKTPTATETPTPTATDLPTATPTKTPVGPTRVPATKVPPTLPPPPPTAVLGADLGITGVHFRLESDATASKGDRIYFVFQLTNSNPTIIPYGILGVTAHDSAGNAVGLAQARNNGYLDAFEFVREHRFMKIYQTGEMDLYVVICLSSNDIACTQPGADWHQLSPPITVTITD
jgi:hypothetical protein